MNRAVADDLRLNPGILEPFEMEMSGPGGDLSTQNGSATPQPFLVYPGGSMFIAEV